MSAQIGSGVGSGAEHNKSMANYAPSSSSHGKLGSGVGSGVGSSVGSGVDSGVGSGAEEE